MSNQDNLKNNEQSNKTMVDKLQLQEWLDSIDNVLAYDSPDAAHTILKAVIKRYNDYLIPQDSPKDSQSVKQNTIWNSLSINDALNTQLVAPSHAINTPYINSIAVNNQPIYPGNIEIEQTISAYIRWNAMAMVLRANKVTSELGGHIASYASAATLYEVGFNHFFHAANDNHSGDMVFFQGHSSPGIYARTFLEGGFNENKLNNFRQEALKDGLSSYPHPWLMPHYWQFPTVSMGLGPLMAISQARFMKYLNDRELVSTEDRKVWCFIGDGETSEPETLGNIHIASRDKLDNLIFVINCNLQRLDGPVNGNGKIIQDLEGVFHGAGWKVIKVIWGSGWDSLLSQDKTGKLHQLMMEVVDGDYQTYRSQNGAYIREYFFGRYEETKALVAHMSDDEIWALTRGGHDCTKVYSAYYEAVNNNEGKPVVVLAKTIKGYGMRGEGESQNVAHQQKKLTDGALQNIRNEYKLPISDEDISEMPFLKLATDSQEYQYLHQRRSELGGYLPRRIVKNETLNVPALDAFDVLLKGSGEGREISTTMAFVRILNILVKDKQVGKRIIPIVPDESRTFGMEGMFRQLGIWSHVGQLYTPEDAKMLMFYKEDVKGQIFQEGLNEAGGITIWIAAATSHVNNHFSVIPFYIYYSMFGFQRIGDFAWAAGDMRARGFLLGGTSGRTTLNGEGLQHEDGHSHVQAGLIPNCESYDPTFAYELAVIIAHGLEEMYVKHQDKFYYITLMNENYEHPAMPSDDIHSKRVQEGIIKGGYLFKQVKANENKHLQATKEDNKTAQTTKTPKATSISVNLMGSGTIFREAIEAAQLLANDFAIDVNLFSVPSYNNLGRDGMEVRRYNMLHPDKKAKIAYITELLSPFKAAVTVSATDYVCSYSEQIRQYVPSDYVTLGTDGFGRSDFRVNLRKFFGVDRYYIVLATMHHLYTLGLVELSLVQEVIKKYAIDVDSQSPWCC